MKPLFLFTSAIALVLSMGWLLVQQMSAHTQEQPLPLEQANQLSRDLIPSCSQGFLRQGRKQIKEKIQNFTQEQNDLGEPILNNFENAKLR
jgi:hypothetical protein